MTLPEFKTWFDPQLQRAIHTKLETYHSFTADRSVLSYCDHIEQLVTHGGKRVRPYLAWLMYRSCGGTDDTKLLPTLIALELFHTFCLIHDDIIDHGTQRHGVPTLHAVVAHALHTDNRLGDVTHMSESQALLAGDLLFAAVTETLGAVPKPVHHTFFTMINQVILGQMIDVDTSTRPTISRDTLNEKMILKTASYTFSTPLTIGAHFAEQPDKQAWCETVGQSIGLAFQIQDDLLDITGLMDNAENKTAGNDLRNGQHTFLTLHITENGSQEDKSELARYFYTDFADDAIPHIVDLFTRAGALDAARQEVSQHIAQARTTIHEADFPSPYNDRWHDLLHLLESRA